VVVVFLQWSFDGKQLSRKEMVVTTTEREKKRTKKEKKKEDVFSNNIIQYNTCMVSFMCLIFCVQLLFL